jgi:RNA polymerase sigma-70 factor (ECF subfamily)
MKESRQAGSRVSLDKHAELSSSSYDQAGPSGAAASQERGTAKAASQEASRRELVRRIAEGDEGAMAALYDGSSRLVHAVALRILIEPADAEEVTLDVYTQVWRSASTFDPSRGSVNAWLVALARSRAIDRVRSSTARARYEQLVADFPETPAEGADPETAASLRRQQSAVLAALAQISAEQRTAIHLAYFSGLSHNEIAVRLGTPLGTVKTRIRQGMIKLREHLGAQPAGAGGMD